MVLSFEAAPQVMSPATSWDKAKIIFHEKIKESEGGDLAKVQQFLRDSTTVKQALECCESIRKKADSEYSKGSVTIGGKEIFLQKTLGRILKKVQMFVQFGDIALQQNPDTTALVWAAFRMMLQLAINDIETCEFLTDACEGIASTLFLCEVYERRYKVVSIVDDNSHEVAERVVEQIPPLYAVVLELSFDAKKFLGHQKIARFLKSNSGLKFRGLLSSIKEKMLDMHATAGVAFQEEALVSLAGLREELKDQIGDVRQFIQDFLSPVAEDTNKTVHEIHTGQKKQAKLEEQKRLEAEHGEIVKWLEPLDNLGGSGSEYRLNLDRRQPNTCTWIFNCTGYNDFYQSDSSGMLWISGNAGFGKSVLVSAIIEKLKEECDSRIVLFFFCKTGDDSTQRAASILRNLIFQLYQNARESSPELCAQCTKIIKKAQDPGTTKGRMTMSEYAKSVKGLKQILEEIIEIFGKNVFIVIDAVDECKDRKPEALLAALQGLVDADLGIKIILASRPEVDICEALRGTPKVEVNQDSNSADIKAYLVKELKRLSSLTAKDRKIACKAIIERSDGMFRYANMQIDRLRQPWRPPLKNHLNDLPVGIEASYRQIFEEIRPEFQELLIVTLRWTILADGDVPALLVAEDYKRVFELDEEHTGGENHEDDDEDDEGDEGDETDEEEEIYQQDEADRGDEADNRERVKNHDEMLKDTLMHIKEAGSVFLESKANETVVGLRHTSVKDFVLREGEKTNMPIDSQEALCQRCKKPSQTSTLAITPKLGHLTLALTIFSHLTSTTFIERYLPGSGTVADDQLNKEGNSSTEVIGDCNEENLKDDDDKVSYHNDNAECGGDSSHSSQKDEAEGTFEDNGDPAHNTEDELIAAESKTGIENKDLVEEDLVQLDTGIDNDGRTVNETEAAPNDDTDPEKKDEDKLSDTDSDLDDRDEQQAPDKDAEVKPRYELTHWMYHLREAENLWPPEEREKSTDWARLWKLVDKFLFKNAAAFIRWQYAVWWMDYPYGFDDSSVGEPIHVAASYGLTALVERLLERGVNVSSTNKEGMTALHLAATTQEPRMVELLLKHGADANAKDAYTTTPLYRVASKLNGNAKIAKLLLDNGATTEGIPDFCSPLHSACLNGNLEVFRLLIAHKADVTAKDYQGESPLHCALKRIDPPSELIEELIKHGADVNGQDNSSQAPLDLAAQSGSAKIVSILLNSGADINDDDVFGRTALHSAAADGNLEIVKLLVERGANLNLCDRQGISILALAVRYSGNLDVARYLLQKLAAQGDNSYITAVDIRGQTVLHAAAAGGNLGIVKLLIEEGADLGLRDKKGNSALSWAVQGGSMDIVQYLLQQFAAKGGERSYITAVDTRGRTALHRAAAKGHVEIVKMLLEVAGADSALRARDNVLGMTPLHSAAFQGHDKVVDILLEYGGDMGVKNRLGETPFDMALKGWNRGTGSSEGGSNCLICMIKNSQGVLVDSRRLLHIAAKKGNESIVRYLLELGANPNEVDEHGWTPMLFALCYEKPAIAKILESHGANPLTFLSGKGGDSHLKIGNPPTCLVNADLSPAIIVSEDGIELHNTGTGTDIGGGSRGSRGQARADHPIPAGRYTYYFEVDILEASDPSQEVGILNAVAIGICEKGVPLNGKFPGWERGSYGYHGDDGNFFQESGWGANYGETYGPGDTVGCAVDLKNGAIFFTKNGKSQGIAFNGVCIRGAFYPVIGLLNNAAARVNFGHDIERPFRYTPGAIERSQTLRGTDIWEYNRSRTFTRDLPVFRT